MEKWALKLEWGDLKLDKYSPYPGDIIDAKLEPGEFVMNRNAVNAIGKDKLEEMNNANSRYPNEMQAGGVAEQNALKLKRAKTMTEPFSPQYVGNMSRDAYKTALKDKFNLPMKNIQVTDSGYNKWVDGSWRNFQSPMAVARIKAEKAQAVQAQMEHSKNSMPHMNNPFTLDPTGGSKPKEPPPLNSSSPVVPEWLSTLPTAQSLEMGVTPVASSNSSWRAEKKYRAKRGATRKAEIDKATAVRHAERIRMVHDAKRRPNPQGMMSLRQMAESPRGSEAKQLSTLLETSTLDDLKMSHPVAYETMKKRYGFGFESSSFKQNEAMDRAEQKTADKVKATAKHGKEYNDLISRAKEVSAQGEELRGEQAFEEQMQTEKDMMKKAQWTSNLGLPGWENDQPRKIANQMIAGMMSNNGIEQKWVDGEYDDAQKEQFQYGKNELTGNFQSYVDSVLTTGGTNMKDRTDESRKGNRAFRTSAGHLTGYYKSGPQPTQGERQITTEEMKERAQNLRALVHSSVDIKGIYNVDNNPTGVSPEQLSEMNAVIDDGLQWNLQGRETASEGEYRKSQGDLTAAEVNYEAKQKIEKAKKDNEIAAAARQAAIDNMQTPEEKKGESVRSRLKSAAGSLLFGQRGGSVGFQEGGNVSLNNSRRLYNVARRKYA